MSSINEKIIINEMDKPELIGNIIDIFEDFLDDKGLLFLIRKKMKILS